MSTTTSYQPRPMLQIFQEIDNQFFKYTTAGWPFSRLVDLASDSRLVQKPALSVLYEEGDTAPRTIDSETTVTQAGEREQDHSPNMFIEPNIVALLPNVVPEKTAPEMYVTVLLEVASTTAALCVILWGGGGGGTRLSPPNRWRFSWLAHAPCRPAGRVLHFRSTSRSQHEQLGWCWQNSYFRFPDFRQRIVSFCADA